MKIIKIINVSINIYVNIVKKLFLTLYMSPIALHIYHVVFIFFHEQKCYACNILLLSVTGNMLWYKMSFYLRSIDTNTKLLF